MSADKSKADRLAEWLDHHGEKQAHADAAAELRRLDASEAALIEALNEMLAVFAKPHNETLCEVVSARATITRAKEARNG